MFKNNSDLPVIESVDSANRLEPFPLITLQQSYLIGRSDKVELGGISSQGYYEVDFDDLDVDKFCRTWNRLVERHEMLRIRFNDNNQQQFMPHGEGYQVEINDFSQLSAEQRESELSAIRERIVHGQLPIEGPMFHLQISQLSANQHRVHFAIDMLIGDLSCLFLIYREFGILYANPESELPAIELSFRDYVYAYEKLEQYDDYQKAKKYWLDRLADFPNAPELPLQPVAMPRGGQIPSRYQFILSSDTWHNLKMSARKYRVTPTILLLTAFSQVLSMWSKNKRFALNVTMMNRLPLHEQVNLLFGEFTSTTLLEIDCTAPADFAERAMKVRQQLKTDMDNKLYSGIEFLREIVREKGAFNEAVMGVVFTSYLHFANQIRNQGDWDVDQVLSTKRLGYNTTRTTQVAIDHQVCELKDGSVVLWWDAIACIFPDGMLDDMLASYEQLLRALADDQTIHTADLFPESQRQQRHEVNDVTAPVSTQHLHTGFVEQAAKTPDAIAIIHDDITITYEQLNRWSDGLAAQIRAQGVKPNQLVAIIGYKGWEQVVAAMAIVKSGGAYMPLDANLPIKRLSFLVEQSDCTVAVSSTRCREITNQFDQLTIFTLTPQWLESLPSEPLDTVNELTDIGYVIFTSGSTGTPKGVVIDHRGAVNTCVDINRRFNVDENDSVLALSSLSFDLSVYDIFGMLAVGGKLIIPDESDIKNLERWWQLVDQHKITVWNTVPLLMQLMVDYCEKIGSNCLEQLKLVMMSGDWIPVKLPDRIRELSSPQNQIVSLGGATEASIWSIFHVIDKPTVDLRTIPYGKPLTNQTFHVLDDHMNDCPTWVVGQLFIGGIGVAKGYWKDKTKTDASFIKMDNGEILYRTGDLGRYTADGNIEIMGREDNQIKIQGYRVELGEIDKSINEHPMVSTCVVNAVGDQKGRKALVAYVVYRKANDLGDAVDYFEVDSEGAITDAAERSVFQLAQHGIRTINNSEAVRVEDGSSIVQTLNGLRQHKFDNHPLPKYLYGSASSLYPVQVYLYVSDAQSGLSQGSYYYYSVDNSLIKLSDDNIVEAGVSATDGPIRAYYIADMAAIKPMYPLHLAHELVQLEAGYMAQIIDQAATDTKLGINHNWSINEALTQKPLLPQDALWLGYSDLAAKANSKQSLPNKPIASDDLQADGIITLTSQAVAADGYDFLQRQSFRSFSGDTLTQAQLAGVLQHIDLQAGLSYLLYVKPDAVEGLDSQWYSYQQSLQLVPLKSQDAAFNFAHLYSQANASIFSGANFVLLLLADKALEPIDRHQSLIASGQIGQHLMARCWQHLVGLCPIGMFDEKTLFEHLALNDEFKVVHQFIGGCIGAEQLNDWQVSGRTALMNCVPTDRELMAFLDERLPTYMVPRLYMVLDNLPMTPTGKVDRKSLPEVDFAKLDDDNYRAPETPLEQSMVELWQELLEVERVGIDDNFFILGGNSLLAMKMIAHLRADFQLDIGLARLFESPTIAAMLSHVHKDHHAEDEGGLDIYTIRQDYLKTHPAHNNADGQLFSTSFSQQYLFAFEQLTDKQSAYNILLTLQIDGTLDINLLQRTLVQLLQRHEALRTAFVYRGGQLLQQVTQATAVELLRVTLADYGDQSAEDLLKQELKSEAAMPFELDQGVVRFKLFKLADDQHILTLNVHHIVADFMSMEILRRDVIALYEANLTEQAADLPQLSLHFVDFALWQNAYLQSAAANKQMAFWTEKFKNMPKTILPDEQSKPASDSNAGKFLDYKMPQDLLAQVNQMCKAQDVTVFMVGFAAIAQMIAGQTGQQEISIGTPITTRHFDELEPVIGLMLNTLVIRIPCEQNQTGLEFMQAVKSACMQAFENKEIPYEKVIEQLKQDGVQDTDSLYRVRYVYRNVQSVDEQAHCHMSFKDMQMDQSDAKFDLLVNLNEKHDGLDGILEYKSALWHDATVQNMAVDFAEIMRWLATSPQKTLSELQQQLNDGKAARMKDSAKSSKRRRAGKLKALLS